MRLLILGVILLIAGVYLGSSLLTYLGLGFIGIVLGVVLLVAAVVVLILLFGLFVAFMDNRRW